MVTETPGSGAGMTKASKPGFFTLTAVLTARAALVAGAATATPALGAWTRWPRSGDGSLVVGRSVTVQLKQAA